MNIEEVNGEISKRYEDSLYVIGRIYEGDSEIPLGGHVKEPPFHLKPSEFDTTLGAVYSVANNCWNYLLGQFRDVLSIEEIPDDEKRQIQSRIKGLVRIMLKYMKESEETNLRGENSWTNRTYKLFSI